MTVDSRLDDLETFRINANRRLKNLEDADTAELARLDQMQAQMTMLTQAASANSQAIAQLQIAQAQILNGCVALQDAMNLFRFQVHRTLHGEGPGL